MMLAPFLGAYQGLRKYIHILDKHQKRDLLNAIKNIYQPVCVAYCFGISKK